jgi:hypothetical protein
MLKKLAIALLEGAARRAGEELAGFCFAVLDHSRKRQCTKPENESSPEPSPSERPIEKVP